MEDFLVFDRVSKNFGTHCAVDEVSLSVGKGEVFSLLGPSGCGKTTLLRMAAGFERPDSGRILLEGKDITHLPPEKRPVNTVFQNYALFPHLSVWENIAFGLRVAGKDKAHINREVELMLALTQLSEHARKNPSQLSGGQRQRVAIARALVNRPQVLLLDEPLAALDLKLRQHLLTELHRLHEEIGITFIYVTHDQAEAMGLSSRIAVMNSGRLEQLGSPQALYEKPANRFVASFIGDTNFLPGIVTQLESSERCLVKIESLGELRVSCNDKCANGDAVEVSIRPEHLLCDSASTHGEFPAVIEDKSYLGSTTRLWVKAGTHRLQVELASQSGRALSLSKGQTLSLGFAPQHALALPISR
jgi:spermidine/putrescine transport system ATP-binding protein